MSLCGIVLGRVSERFCIGLLASCARLGLGLGLGLGMRCWLVYVQEFRTRYGTPRTYVGYTCKIRKSQVFPA